MSNGNAKNGGIGTLLTTLAGSGDKMIQLLIVAGIILNGVWTKNNGKGISDNAAELDALRKQVARQVKVIHSNQKTYLQGINDARANHEAIMDKLGIAHTKSTPYPQEEEEN